MDVNSRALEKRAQQQPYFIAAATQAVGGSLIPVPGGVLILGDNKQVIGAIGVTAFQSVLIVGADHHAEMAGSVRRRPRLKLGRICVADRNLHDPSLRCHDTPCAKPLRRYHIWGCRGNTPQPVDFTESVY